MTDELRGKKKKKSITIRVTVELGSIPFHPPILQFSRFRSDEAVFQHVSSDLCSSIPAGYRKPIFWLTPPGPQVSAAHMWMATALMVQSGRFVASFPSNPAPFNTRADGWGAAIQRALRSAPRASACSRQTASGGAKAVTVGWGLSLENAESETGC